jgi:transposase
LSREAPFTELSREELIALICAQRGAIEKQQAVIEQLRAEIEGLKRSGHRSAAPFSKGKGKSNPKPPGRKPGEGDFRFRAAPPQAPQEVILAEVPSRCPDCGGKLERVAEEWATTTDVEVNPQPRVTGYHVPVCRCRQCGKRVRGTAPGLAADQAGATAHRLGPSVKAAAHVLHYGMGIPVRKVPQVLQELTGVAVTQGALTQDALRQAEGKVGTLYQQLRASMADAPVVHTDDTGWRIAGQSAFLMGFDSDQATVYQIRAQHRHEEVLEVVPADYGGVLVSDRGQSYEAHELQGWQQQKCLAHLLRNVSDVVEQKCGMARQFGLGLKMLLREGIALWKERPQLAPEKYQALRQDLNDQLTHYLRDRKLRDVDNQRLLNGIGEQNDKGRLLRFLFHCGVEPTNNRAERILRPAVIARKLSHCSKNQRGADAFSAFASVIQTVRKSRPVSLIHSLLACSSP